MKKKNKKPKPPKAKMIREGYPNPIIPILIFSIFTGTVCILLHENPCAMAIGILIGFLSFMAWCIYDSSKHNPDPYDDTFY